VVQEKINDDDEAITNFKCSSFYVLMKEIGFNYEKSERKCC
jgi:hypothetical protein